MPILGYQDVYEPDFLSALRAASDQGFHYAQFDLNVPGLYIDRLPRRRLHEIRSAASDLGVSISLHAPGDIVGLFTDYPSIRQGILNHFERVLEQANELGAHHMTVSDLVDIAIEALSDMFQHGTDLFLALDWAKLHKADLLPEDAQLAFYQKHKARIRELHLHDRDTSGRTHLAPGQGSLDFHTLFEKFYEESQWLTIEVRPFSEAVQAKERFLRILQETQSGMS